MKLTIYHGKQKPFKAVGKNQVNMLSFAFKYPTWHCHATDRATINALQRLTDKGVLIVNDYGQFKINL
jgi:hypothetical protein